MINSLDNSAYFDNVMTQATSAASATQFATQQQSLDKAQTKEQIQAKAREFEAVFVSQMLRHMWDGVEVDDVFGGGNAEEIWRDMMVDEYGTLIVKRGGIGVADHVARELLKLQEISNE